MSTGNADNHGSLQWQASGVDFGLAIAKARAHLPLHEVLEVLGLGPFSMLLSEEGYTEVAQMRQLAQAGELEEVLLGYGCTGDDVAKVSRAVCFEALEGDGDFFEDDEIREHFAAGVPTATAKSNGGAGGGPSQLFLQWGHEECLAWLHRYVPYSAVFFHVIVADATVRL